MVDWVLVFLPHGVRSRDPSVDINTMCGEIRASGGIVYSNTTGHLVEQHTYNPLNTVIITVGGNAKRYMADFPFPKICDFMAFINLIDPTYVLVDNIDTYTTIDARGLITAIGEKIRGLYPGPTVFAYVVPKTI